MRRTRGSETSQYPEEKKSKEIPSVAASERGGAQTRGQIESAERDRGRQKQHIKSYLISLSDLGGCRTAEVGLLGYS